MKSGVNLGMKYLFSVLKMYMLIENACKIIWKFLRDAHQPFSCLISYENDYRMLLNEFIICDFWVSPETE